MLPLIVIVALVADPVPAASPSPATTIVYQPPSHFRELPTAIRRELEKGGYLIPQPFGQRGKNVVRGRFDRRGQVDWAVLCSKSGTSRILVFWPDLLRERTRLPPVVLMHDGIEDSFIEKTSVVRYRHEGRWLELAGVD